MPALPFASSISAPNTVLYFWDYYTIRLKPARLLRPQSKLHIYLPSTPFPSQPLHSSNIPFPPSAKNLELKIKCHQTNRANYGAYSKLRTISIAPIPPLLHSRHYHLWPMRVYEKYRVFSGRHSPSLLEHQPCRDNVIYRAARGHTRSDTPYQTGGCLPTDRHAETKTENREDSWLCSP